MTVQGGQTKKSFTTGGHFIFGVAKSRMLRYSCSGGFYALYAYDSGALLWMNKEWILNQVQDDKGCVFGI
ncbi:MAG: hypothetical protein GYB39_11295 [Algicola sp.]|nr:hypothetical protein [Algicola sp.]